MEGQWFRDRAPEFAAAGAEIVGISFDRPDENKAFDEAQGFGYRLLSDPDRAVGEQYGVTNPPDLPRAPYARRFTHLIDPSGTVVKIYEVTDVATHPQAVLDDIRRLQGAPA
ncbi:MAG: redoxin domain-containing protein [Actinobacteria bacterium]|nr:MAG: redoxin domain-containing protein [Actinomycetota bacterium]